MAVVNLKIHNQHHQIACDDGQEDHLRKIAYNLDSRMKKMQEIVNTAPDYKLLLMVALTIEDELHDIKSSMQNKGLAIERNNNENIAKTLDAITDYVENLAKRLESL